MATNTHDHGERCECPACSRNKRISAGTGNTSGSAPTWSLDAITSNLIRTGRSWNSERGKPVTVTYSFMSSAPGDYRYNREERGFSGFSMVQMAAAEKALKQWAEVANIKFVRVEGNQGQVRFGNTTTGPNVAWAYYPGAGRGGDIWVNPNYSHNSRLNDGDYGYKTMVHEIGHAIGLSHPGNYNGSANFSQRLYNQDSRKYSVMSYFNHADHNTNRFYSTGPMIHDIAAAQKLYGANMTVRTGDDVYKWADGSKVMKAIWDAGGNDTIDASNQRHGAKINLNEGAFSSIGVNAYGGNVKDNISIAHGAKIENAIGSKWNDELIGNDLDNVLNGGEGTGRDTLTGGGGNDRLIGGAGNDTYIFEAGWGNDVIEDSDHTAHIRFADVKQSDLKFSRTGDDLVVTRTGSEDKLTVKQFYGGAGSDWTFSGSEGGFKPSILVGGGKNHPSVVRAKTDMLNLVEGQTVAATDLFEAYDPDGDRITHYKITDSNQGESAGHFELDGKVVSQKSGTRGRSFTIRAEDVSRLKFVADDRKVDFDYGMTRRAFGTDSITIQAFDGTSWGQQARIQAKTEMDYAGNTKSTLTGHDITLKMGESLSVKDMFKIVDPDGDKHNAFGLMDHTYDDHEKDKSGRFYLNDKNWYRGGRWQTTSQGGFSKVRFFAGTEAGTDTVSFKVFDGKEWSDPITLKVHTVAGETPENRAPVVETLDGKVNPNGYLTANRLVHAWDPDRDKVTKFRFMDSGEGGGSLTVNGTQAAVGQWVEVDASDLFNVRFQGSATKGTEQFKVQALAGETWSETESVELTTGNNTPIVGTKTAKVASGDTVAASELFTVTDKDNDAMTKFRFMDSNGKAGSGAITINGVEQAAGQWVEIDAADLHKVGFKAGATTGYQTVDVQAFDGEDWSQAYTRANIQVTAANPNRKPVVDGHSKTLKVGQTISASSLVSASDPDGDTITKYRFYDRSGGATSGYFVKDGYAYRNKYGGVASYSFEVDAADLHKVTFVAGSSVGRDTLQVQAFDGKEWSNYDTMFVTTVKPNTAPVVKSENVKIDKGASVALSDLVNVTDADGDAITKYRIYDTNIASTSGRLTVNGTETPLRGWVTIDAKDFANAQFRSATKGGTVDRLYVQAFDGKAWSSMARLNVTSGDPNHAPVVSAGSVKIDKHSTVAVSDFFKVTDADGDAITKYSFRDVSGWSMSGSLTVDGQIQAAYKPVVVDAANLDTVKFKAAAYGGYTDYLYVKAFDGESWSRETLVRVTSGDRNRAPVLKAMNVSVNEGTSVAANTLFTVSDADGDAMVKYRFLDTYRSTGTATITIDGKAVTQSGWITVNASDLGKVAIQGGTRNLTERFYVQAYDGQRWSNYGIAKVTSIVKPNIAPVVSAGPVKIEKNSTVAVSDFFKVTDADGDAITKYSIRDASTWSRSGSLVVNGVKHASYKPVVVNAGDLDSVKFQAATYGGYTDYIYVKAFDGRAWSKETLVKVTSGHRNRAPVVSAQKVSVNEGTSVAASSLFTVTDADGDAMTKYRFLDSYRSTGTAAITINGKEVTQSGWVTVDAKDLDTVAIRGGSRNMTESIYVQAYDGQAWSSYGIARVTSITRPNVAPVVGAKSLQVDMGGSVAASDLFTVTDADGDAMTKYRFYDTNRNTSSGNLTIDGKAVTTRGWVTVDAGDMDTVRFDAGTLKGTTDRLYVQAYDGKAWSNYAVATVQSGKVNRGPTVTAKTVTTGLRKSLELSSLFTACDPDGDAITKYRFYDAYRNADTGYLTMDGKKQSGWGWFNVDAKDLSRARFVSAEKTGRTEYLYVQAHDGQKWSNFGIAKVKTDATHDAWAKNDAGAIALKDATGIGVSGTATSSLTDTKKKETGLLAAV